MHIEGAGTLDQVAGGVRKVYRKIKEIRGASPQTKDSFGANRYGEKRCIDRALQSLSTSSAPPVKTCKAPVLVTIQLSTTQNNRRSRCPDCRHALTGTKETKARAIADCSAMQKWFGPVFWNFYTSEPEN